LIEPSGSSIRRSGVTAMRARTLASVNTATNNSIQAECEPKPETGVELGHRFLLLPSAHIGAKILRISVIYLLLLILLQVP